MVMKWKKVDEKGKPLFSSLGTASEKFGHIRELLKETDLTHERLGGLRKDVSIKIAEYAHTSYEETFHGHYFKNKDANEPTENSGQYVNIIENSELVENAPPNEQYARGPMPYSRGRHTAIFDTSFSKNGGFLGPGPKNPTRPSRSGVSHNDLDSSQEANP